MVVCLLVFSFLTYHYKWSVDIGNIGENRLVGSEFNEIIICSHFLLNFAILINCMSIIGNYFSFSGCCRYLRIIRVRFNYIKTSFKDEITGSCGIPTSRSLAAAIFFNLIF